MSDRMKLAVEIFVENGQFKAEIVNSEQLTKKLGATGKKSFGDLAEAAERVPGRVGEMSSRIRELGVFLEGAIGGLLAAAAAVAAFAAATLKGSEIAGEHQRQLLKLEAQIHATGNAAGKSAQQLDEQSVALEGSTMFSGEQIRAAQSRLLTFTSVTGKEFDRAMQTAADLASVMGSDVASAAELLGKALENPADAIGALTRAGIKLQPEQEKMITAFAEAGQKGEALTAVLDAVQARIGGTAQKEAEGYAGSIHKLGAAWDNFLEALEKTGPIEKAAKALEDLLNSGRSALKPTGQEEFNQLAAERAALKADLASHDYGNEGLLGDSIQSSKLDRLDAVNARMKQLQEERVAREKAESEAAAAAQKKRSDDELVASTKAQYSKMSAVAAIQAKFDSEQVKAQAAAESQILQARFQAGEIAAPKYFERLKQLRLQAIAADIKAVTAARDQAKAEDKGDLAGSLKVTELNTQLVAMQRQRRNIVVNSEQEAQVALTQLVRDGERDRTQIEVETLRMQGKYQEAAQKEREEKYRQMLQQLKKDGRADAEEIAKAWLDSKAVDDQLAEIKRKYDESLKQRAAARLEVQVDLQAGRVSPNEANRKLTDIDNGEAVYLKERLAELNDPKLAKSPATLELIRDIKKEMNDLGQESNETINAITRGLEGGMANAIEGVLNGTRSLKEGFADMGASVVRTLQRIVAEMITMQIINGTLGIFGYSYSGGAVKALPVPVGAADGGLIRRAPGGPVRGPGGPKDDLVPAMLSNGEYVLQESAVRRLGIPFLEALNRGDVPGLTHPARMASGGYVGAGEARAAARATGGLTVNVVNDIDARGADPASTSRMLAGVQAATQQMRDQVFEAIRRGYAPI